MPRPDRPTGYPRTAVGSAAVAVVALVGGWTVAASRYPGFSAVHNSLSTLSARTTPHRWIMTTAFAVTGVALVVTALVMPGLRTRARTCFALGGASVVLVAALPIQSAGVNDPPHYIASVLATSLLALWPWLAADPDGAWTLRPPVARTATVLLAAIGATLLAASVGRWYAFGLVERIASVGDVGWPLVVAVGVWWRHRHAHPGPAARHAGPSSACSSRAASAAP